MTNCKLVAPVAFGFVLMLVGLRAGRAGDQVPAVKVSYEGPSALVLHEPVIVEFTITNQSAEPITFDLGLYRKAHFLMTVTGPSGSVIPVPPFTGPPLGGFGPVGQLPLAPSKHYSQQLLLNEWFSFDQIGSYQVNLRLKTPIATSSGTAVDPATVGRLHFQVAPRDEHVLGQTCQRLAHTAVGAQDTEKELDAARALSYVNDTIGVRYMKWVLAMSERVDSIIIEGLVRIATHEARAALHEVAQSSRGERATLARDALRRLDATSRGGRLH